MGNDIWGGIKKAVTTFAPVLANAIVPGSGGVAGALLAKALGTENDPVKIEAALATASPEQIANIKAEEHRHEEKLVELGLKEDEIALEEHKADLEDKKDARDREIEIQKAGGSNWPMYLLGVVVAAGFFVIMGLLVFSQTAIPEGNRNMAFMLAGNLGAAFITMVQYFWGSSKSSSDKTTLIAGTKGGK